MTTVVAILAGMLLCCVQMSSADVDADMLASSLVMDDCQEGSSTKSCAVNLMQLRGLEKQQEVAQKHDAEDGSEDDAKDEEEDEDEEEAEDGANVTDDVSEEEEEGEEAGGYPMGEKTETGKYCKRGKGTSCYSPRSWLRADLDLKKCNEKCAKGERGCKFFFFGYSGHCSLCKKCDLQEYDDGYDIYAKYVIDYPVKNANCFPKKYSQKRLKKARGCANRAKKLGAVAFSYKSKQCRTWKKCSYTTKATGWQLNKVR